MKVFMILTNGFDPDHRVYKEAKCLTNNGYDVEILCWDRENRHVDREFEIMDGIKIKRFYPKSRYGKGLQQINSYLKFISEIKDYTKDKDYYIVHGHDLDGAFAATFIKKNAKLIWDMHELYDGFEYGKFRMMIYEVISRRCFKKADGIILILQSFLERYKCKISKDTVHEIVSNAAEKSIFDNFNRVKSNKLRISYTGHVRYYDELKYLMDSAKDFEDVIVYINGAGPDYTKLKSINANYKNTVLTGRYHYKDSKKLYENSDITYIVYNEIQMNNKYSFPVKGFESIYTETPVIANKYTHFGKFVEENDIGFVIDWRERDELKELINKILSDKHVLDQKRENIRKIKNDYTWEKQKNNLIRLYTKLIKNY